MQEQKEDILQDLAEKHSRKRIIIIIIALALLAILIFIGVSFYLYFKTPKNQLKIKSFLDTPLN